MGLGGQESIRPYWRCYFAQTNVIIFVVDSSDRERIDIARRELHTIISEEELTRTKVLILANKQDIEGCMDIDKIASELKLTTIKDRMWSIQKISAKTGEGLEQSLNWIKRSVN